MLGVHLYLCPYHCLADPVAFHAFLSHQLNWTTEIQIFVAAVEVFFLLLVEAPHVCLFHDLFLFLVRDLWLELCSGEGKRPALMEPPTAIHSLQVAYPGSEMLARSAFLATVLA